ncbi:MAG: c-type cytochrome biogenesis protein CcmI [Pseudomonadota bacterium]
MGTFIAIAAVAALATGVILVWPMLRSQGNARVRAEFDTALYRDQLAEIDRDLERGTVTESEAEGAKAEISRRLLAAAREAKLSTGIGEAPRMSSGMVAGLSILAVPIAAAGFYFANGAPGQPDMPFDGRAQVAQATPGQQGGRPTQEQAEQFAPEREVTARPDQAEYAALVERLEERIDSTPNDARGLRLLATSYMQLERYADAWRAFDRLIGVIGIEHAEADLFAQMAEGMILAAGGYVSPEAEQMIGAALERDNRNFVARYYAGLSLSQNGMMPEAIRVWQDLRAEAPADAPWLPWLDDMLGRALEFQNRGMAGLGGPSQDEIAAAEGLSEEERNMMVNDMVQRLEDRLRDQGGSAQEYAQLIASRTVLEEWDKAEDALELARAELSGEELAAVERRAAELGVGGAARLPLPDQEEQPDQQATLPGPTAADIEAAAEMTVEDRQEMILTMVSRLEERLMTEGGDSNQWFRLMNSYVQLGMMEEASRVYDLSQERLSGQEAGFLREQALVMGVIGQ